MTKIISQGHAALSVKISVCISNQRDVLMYPSILSNTSLIHRDDLQFCTAIGNFYWDALCL